MKVFADMQVNLSRIEAEEILFDADTEDCGYLTLDSWYVTSLLSKLPLLARFVCSILTAGMTR